MTNILGHVAKQLAKAQRSQFRPTTTEEFFALRLAVRLGEGAAARHYADLTQQYSQAQLLGAYTRALASHADIPRRFHWELEPVSPNGSGNGSGKSLAAIHIERRAVTVAVFAGDHLKYADARQLSSSSGKAAASAGNFVAKFCEKFQFTSAVLETLARGEEVRRAVLRDAISKILRLHGIAIAEVPEEDLLAAFGHPPLLARKYLRKVIARIYPVLEQALGAPWTYDAAALGLYLQTERLFQNINRPLL